MLFPNRKYKSGTKWGVWLWTDTPSGYIDRLHLIKTPFGAICVHWLNKPDPEPFVHNHPVSFLSLIFKGWYREKREIVQEYYSAPGVSYKLAVFDKEKTGIFKRRFFNTFRATDEDRHTIVEISPGGCVTLCFMGPTPKGHVWGYFTPDGKIFWKDYNRQKYTKV